MKKRITWIDLAKGICMISVVLGHQGNEYLNIVYAYHLTTFFILAGYTLRREEVTGKYLANKFNRLMIPYFVTCACVTIMDVINAVIIQRNISNVGITKIIYTNILRAFFASGTYTTFGKIETGTFIGAIWFLPAMFFALSFTQCIINRFEKWTERAGVSILIATLGCLTAPFLWLPFSVQSAMAAIPFILFGFWMRDNKLEEQLQVKHYVVFAIVYLVGCLTNYAQVFWLVTCTMKDYIITPVIAVCASLLVIGVSKKIGQNKILEFIGRNSMIFLCVHLFEMNTLSRYFSYFLRLIKLGDSLLAYFCVEMIFIGCISWGIVFVKNRMPYKKVDDKVPKHRNQTVDIMRAVLIILMIVGHRSIDGGFSKFIYSFHMMSFVILSGYFYKERTQEKLSKRLGKLMKSLMPYGVFGILYIMTVHVGWTTELKTVLLGVSFTYKLFAQTSSIGPVYFILMLFCIKGIYILIRQYVHSELYINLIVSFLTILGVVLGSCGLWLPWSLDCALFSLVFYQAGYYIKKYNVLVWCCKNPYIYFALAPIWAFMIYRGSMELAVRNYSIVGLTIAGAIAAFIIVYMICEKISECGNVFVCSVLQVIGQSTIYILIVHTLWGPHIVKLVENVLCLNPNNIFHLSIILLLQVAIGCMVFGIDFSFKKLYNIK